jgi:hypothetical protein
LEQELLDRRQLRVATDEWAARWMQSAAGQPRRVPWVSIGILREDYGIIVACRHDSNMIAMTGGRR